jgi:hypothetical protein
MERGNSLTTLTTLTGLEQIDLANSACSGQRGPTDFHIVRKIDLGSSYRPFRLLLSGDCERCRPKMKWW